jgi:5'-3' exonuclease
MILVDYNQAAISSIYIFADDLKAGKDPENIVRHCVISMLLSYKKKYGPKYGEMIVCCDSTNYWRKDIFKHYKAGRKKSRDESDLPWDTIFKIINQVREDIKQHFPWRVVHVDRCEADDIIAVLSKNSGEITSKKFGLYNDDEPVLIISSDHDYKQLHVMDNVKQWCPRNERLITVTSKKEIQRLIMEHIVKGDAGDGIPNIRMPSSYFVKGKKVVPRQKQIKSTWLEEFYDKGIDACQTKLQRHRYLLNERLVSFEFIPELYSTAIMKYYNENPPKGDKTRTFEYLVKHRCRILQENITDF